jgi:Pyridoxamine 5'-phosphate oxidase
VSFDVDDIPRCFEGEIPAVIVTSAADGTPIVVHVSHVFRVDHEHVAISNQFFAKTIANLRVNPVAVALCIDPPTLDSYRLLLRHLRSESAGSTFDVVKRTIDAVAHMTGMADVFALRSVEVFRVLDIEQVPNRGTLAPA